MFDLSFYRNQSEWKHKLLTIEISKNESDGVIDLIFYKIQYVFFTNLHVFSDKFDSKFVRRGCLSSYSSQNGLIKHQQRCDQQEKTSIRTSDESQLYSKKHFHKNPHSFRILADFEADNEIDNSTIGDKTILIYKQNPVTNGFYIVSEMSDVLQSGHY